MHNNDKPAHIIDVAGAMLCLSLLEGGHEPVSLIWENLKVLNFNTLRKTPTEYYYRLGQYIACEELMKH